MSADTLANTVKFGVAIAAALLAALAWSLYRSPAMAMLTEAFRFCG